jgi:hypothetical protein
MATIRDDWFDVEDLFIRPDHAREKGHLRRLMFRIVERASYWELPVRFWIPWADIHASSGNFETINDAIRQGGLTVKKSGVTWVAYRAEREPLGR